MRRPDHSKPLAGAAFALALTASLAGAGLVVTLRAEEPLASAAPLLAALLLGGAAFAVALHVADGLLLGLVGRGRPERYRRLWRRVWIASPVGWVVGGLVGVFAELP